VAGNPKLVGRIELALRFVGPLLDLALAVGDRVSRVLDRDDPDYVPARMAGDWESAPRTIPERRDRTAGREAEGLVGTAREINQPLA
jgi:hypothetical protein